MMPFGPRRQLGAGAAIRTITGTLAPKRLRPLAARGVSAAGWPLVAAGGTILAGTAARAITTKWLACRTVFTGCAIGTRRPIAAVGTIFPGRAPVSGLTAFTRTTFFAGRAAGGMRFTTWGTITTGTAFVARAMFLTGTAFVARAALLAGPALLARNALLTRAAIIARRAFALERTVFPIGALVP
jgi:hypothetical protein